MPILENPSTAAGWWINFITALGKNARMTNAVRILAAHFVHVEEFCCDVVVMEASLALDAPQTLEEASRRSHEYLLVRSSDALPFPWGSKSS
jgi:hypothetical protein